MDTSGKAVAFSISMQATCVVVFDLVMAGPSGLNIDLSSLLDTLSLDALTHQHMAGLPESYDGAAKHLTQLLKGCQVDYFLILKDIGKAIFSMKDDLSVLIYPVIYQITFFQAFKNA
ncbi:hypothetical protein HD554DRAFT_2040924 [Boletus coccyginus]|nr:hypothetical protein HD554DRAFT_2040924 [Boletus coccyginus]